ncbi:MAG: SMC-Scp complex subunit ScpB, partial [Candidatus Kryptoniota bacterium]
MSEQQYPDGTDDTSEHIPSGEDNSLHQELPQQAGSSKSSDSSELSVGINPEETLGEENIDDVGVRADNNEENLHSNSLDGLDQIVRPGEESSLEVSPKEEVVDDLAHIIEAIIFASDEPLNVGTIKSVLDAAHTFGRINPDMIVARINALNDKYDLDGSGFYIIEIANGYQFATRKELAQWVSYLFKEKAKRKLSNSALETLAIIAYKQPITKPEIESIRGVNVDYVLH